MVGLFVVFYFFNELIQIHQVVLAAEVEEFAAVFVFYPSAGIAVLGI